MKVNKYLKIVVYFYLLVLIYITFFSGQRHSVNQSQNIINLELLVGKWSYFDRFDTLYSNQKRFIILEILGNFMLFMPFAGAAFIILKKQLPVLTVITVLFLLIISIESIQYLFHIGVFDVDDIVLNFTGGLIGLAVFNLFFRKYILK